MHYKIIDKNIQAYLPENNGRVNSGLVNASSSLTGTCTLEYILPVIRPNISGRRDPSSPLAKNLLSRICSNCIALSRVR